MYQIHFQFLMNPFKEFMKKIGIYALKCKKSFDHFESHLLEAYLDHTHAKPCFFGQLLTNMPSGLRSLGKGGF